MNFVTVLPPFRSSSRFNKFRRLSRLCNVKEMSNNVVPCEKWIKLVAWSNLNSWIYVRISEFRRKCSKNQRIDNLACLKNRIAQLKIGQVATLFRYKWTGRKGSPVRSIGTSTRFVHPRSCTYRESSQKKNAGSGPMFSSREGCSYSKGMIDELVRPTLKTRRFRALFRQEITAVPRTYRYV